MDRRIVKAAATVLGLGYFPLGQGTLASLAGLGVVVFIWNNIYLHLLAAALLMGLGFIFSTEAEKIYKEKDSRKIVIDEFSCIFLVYLFVPRTLIFIIAGFVLFRLFDILKVPPMGRLEGLAGARGVMLDDIVAAVYANVCLQVLRIFTT